MEKTRTATKRSTSVRAPSKRQSKAPANGNGSPRSGKAAAKRVVAEKRGIILDVGCGLTKYPGAVGMDAQALEGVDVVWDWNDIPWKPFEDDSVLSIIASHVVEHVDPTNGHFLRWMDEAWRVLKPYGKMAIVAPYGGSGYYWRDPTHVNGLTEESWLYFDPTHASAFYSFYSPKPWRIEQNDFRDHGLMEVVLRKLPEDPAYKDIRPEGIVIT